MKEYQGLKIIGIDNGYGNIKTANCCFLAGLTAYDTEPVFKDELLVYNGKYYLVGTGHKEFAADKTEDDDYYILTLAAIARELNVYHALSNYMNERKANIVSNLFFVAVHLPAYFIHWYCDGIFLLTAMLAQAISAFVLGLIFGVVFRKSKSIWASAIVHFWYDFSLSIFVG